jgi:DNA-binding transcriptional MerR regulator
MPDSDRMLQIGEVAERVGLSLRSVRFYEEAGLLTPAARSEGGFRLYTETQVDRLLLIKRMKPLGFSVDQMRDLLIAYDAVEDPTVEDDDRAGARARLAEFAALATERTEELRKQLAIAEEFAERLQRAQGAR